MSTKHTPGPWFAVEYSGYWALQGEDFYNEHDDLLDDEKCNEAKANATLASAAPELLEAIEALPIVSMYNNAEDFIHAYEDWRDKYKAKVIAKAKGEKEEGR